MKTAEQVVDDWMANNSRVTDLTNADYKSLVAAVHSNQLDAVKHGLTIGADIAEKMEYQCEVNLGIDKRILTARNNLTSL